VEKGVRGIKNPWGKKGGTLLSHAEEIKESRLWYKSSWEIAAMPKIGDDGT